MASKSTPKQTAVPQLRLATTASTDLIALWLMYASGCVRWYTANVFNGWITLKYSDSIITTHALVIENVPYDLLLSRSDMKRF